MAETILLSTVVEARKTFCITHLMLLAGSYSVQLPQPPQTAGDERMSAFTGLSGQSERFILNIILCRHKNLSAHKSIDETFINDSPWSRSQCT